MRRKNAGKKIMAVLIAASLMLTPAEVAVAAELGSESSEETFFSEETEDSAASETEGTAEGNEENTDGSDDGDRVQMEPEVTGTAEELSEDMESAWVEELSDPETMEDTLQEDTEKAVFEDGSMDAVQASAEYSDGTFIWTLDENGTLTITGNNAELTEKDVYEDALKDAGIEFSRVNKLVIGSGITGFDKYSMKNLKTCIKELEINGNPGMKIPEYCFDNLANIESVVISGAVDVPEYMFEKCTGLKKVILKNGILSVGKGAFNGCSSLENVTFQNVSLKKINTSTFFDCSALTSVEVPDTVTEIEYAAFSHSGIRSVRLPENLTAIGDYAFTDCKNLTQIQLPSHLSVLGNSAFRECAALEKIDIPAELKRIESDTFKKTGLTSVTLHEGLEEIGDGAFENCLKLKKIRIPKTVTRIEDLALGVHYNETRDAEEVIPGGFIVEGYTGSAAEKYVKKTSGFTNKYNEPFTGLKFVSVGGQAATATSISKTKISALKTRAFTGKALTQALTITYGSKKLVNGKDYTLTWKNNTNIGTASVTIKGKGNYNGSVTKTFRITVQKNAAYTVSRLKYKISNADTSGKGNVIFTGTTDKTTRKTLTVPSTVKIGGKISV